MTLAGPRPEQVGFTSEFIEEIKRFCQCRYDGRILRELKMEYNVNRWSEKHNFIINGASYIGNPRENTAMFITNKVSGLLSNLENVKHCLVFAEKGINVPDSILQDNCFIFTSNPQRDYGIRIRDG